MNKIMTQVALDLVDEHRALQIAREAVEGGIDWLEAGTPLIKSEGMSIVRKLKAEFPDNIIVADMKTMDVGGLEVEMATKSGAGIVCIMGISEDQTVTEAVKSAGQYGSKVMADLMGVQDKAARARQLEEMGVHYLCVHVSIDEQMVGGSPLAELKTVTEAVNIPVAVAGGLNSETAPSAVENGASIIIVGGAIIKAPDVTQATKDVVRSIHELKPIRSALFKKYGPEELREAFLKVSTPNIADAMHTKGSMSCILPILNRGRKMIGQAITVRTIDGDWAKPVEAIDVAEAGSVIVIDAGGVGPAVWGELATHSCLAKDVKGVVIDGAIRDTDEIRRLGFPAFATLVCSHAGYPKGLGEIGGPIRLCGRDVLPGDWLVGDADGVMHLAKTEAVEMANRAQDVLETENRIRAEIREGRTLSQVAYLEKWEKRSPR
ncbi:MAG: orotidine 5'-phosphate decarboxylase [Thermoplasmata archaeon]|nr:orotidine 5'-phosphate decarboxylase [Thermoplasmata archaeon]